MNLAPFPFLSGQNLAMLTIMKTWVICGVVSVTIFFIFIQPYILRLKEEKERASLPPSSGGRTNVVNSRK